MSKKKKEKKTTLKKYEGVRTDRDLLTISKELVQNDWKPYFMGDEEIGFIGKINGTLLTEFIECVHRGGVPSKMKDKSQKSNPTKQESDA